MRCHDNEVSLLALVDFIDRRRFARFVSETKSRGSFSLRGIKDTLHPPVPRSAGLRKILRCAVTVVTICEARSYENVEIMRAVPRQRVLCFQADNGGLVMVTFYNYFVKCGPQASVSDVAEHIYYIRSLIGVEHIGVGGDFDGINKYEISPRRRGRLISVLIPEIT